VRIILLALWPVAAWAQLEFVADESPPIVFAGKAQQLRVAIRNSTDKEVTTDATYRLFQLSATVAVPVGDAQPWKKLHVLSKQTILEDLPVTLPAVRSATRFRVECAGIGRLTVTALPEDALKRLAGDDLLGVFDPNDKLKPALKAAKVEFVDFEIEPRDVKLVVVLADKLPESILTRVKKGMAAVWFKSTRVPTAYAVRLDAGTVVVAALPAAFDSAASQANLIRYTELALTPDALQLPSDNQTQ
jgi:hypothetical protein